MVSSAIFCTSCGTANRAGSASCYACGTPLQAGNAPAGTAFPHIPSAHAAYSSDPGPSGPLPVLKQRYRSLRRVGNGGFGVVYLAEDMQLGNRPVAVKEMNRGGLSAEEVARAAEAFEREAHLLAGLKHPSLPSIYDHFSQAGHWYLVMDFIEGETLEARLDRLGRLPVEEVLQIGLQLCDVLNYLHNCQPPVIFRDLKPANVIVTPQGHIYLIDFGLARLFDPMRSKTSNPFGSPGYAAPEQYGSPQTTARADIYSLGVTLHRSLTGFNPSLRPFELAPIRFPPDSPFFDLGALIMRMVEMNPTHRPSNVLTIAHELQRIANQLTGRGRSVFPSMGVRPVTPPTSPTTPRSTLTGVPPFAQYGAAPAHPQTAFPGGRNGSPSPTSSGKIVPSVGTVFCIFERHAAVVNSVTWSPDGINLASASDDKTVQLWNTSTADVVLTYRSQPEDAVAVAYAPDGRRIAAGFRGDKREPETFHVFLSSSGGRVFYYGSSGGGFWNARSDCTIYAIAWAPDGGRIACGGGELKVDIWDTRTWRQLVSYKEHDSTIFAIAWSPDGRQIASTGSDNAVHVWDAYTGRNVLTYYKHASVVSAVAWSPNGERIVSASYDKTVQIWNAITGTQLTTYRGHSEQVFCVAWSPDGTSIASGSLDGQVQIWDARKGNHLFTYNGHNGSVKDIKWSPDGKRLASASADRTVHIWRAS